MLQKIRNKLNKKGFTLVELIVVLVILAILAALLIPALTGYIDKANQEKVTAECRMAVMAIQTEATSVYGASGVINDSTFYSNTSVASNIVKLSEVSGNWKAHVSADGKVNKVVYTNAGWTCTYTAATGTGTAAAYNVSSGSDASVTSREYVSSSF